MSLRNGGRKKRKKLRESVETLFFTRDQEEINEELEELREDNVKMGEDQGERPQSGGGRLTRGSESDAGGIEPGERPPSWFERMENRTEENAKRGRENSKLLTLLDYRTVWITRLLTGVLVALLGAGVIELIGL